MKVRFRPKILIKWLIILGILVGGYWYFFKYDRHFLSYQADADRFPVWGVTFSRVYAEELGLDWRQAYIAMIDDLKITSLRLPVYWSDIERTEGVIDYSDYDWMLSEGGKRGVKFILVVGRRQPRWPECHTPEWLADFPEEKIRDRELNMIADVVKRWRDTDAVVAWQAENEYFVDWFGNCPRGDKEYLQSVIARIRSIDAERKIYLTDSGEFSSWKQVSKLSKNIGTTMYRVAWNPYLGYTYTAWPAWFYGWKASWNRLEPSETIVAELQAEPWPRANSSMKNLTDREIQQSFPLQQLETNAEVARRTGFSQVYFWGAEWWYLRLLQGDDSYWNAAKEIIHPAHEKN